MCGRYVLRLKEKEITGQLALPVSEDFEWQPSYNIAPSQKVPAVVRSPEKHLTLLHWGLIPHWMKANADGSVKGFINARSESAAQKPSFRTAFQHNRCLILADGFYEWKKLTGRNKQPMFFALEDHSLMTFAGLWSIWTSPTGETLNTCTILTTTPNPLVAESHDRMPVILPIESRNAWLQEQELPTLQTMLKPYPAEKMIGYPVSNHVNSPRYNDPLCIEPQQSLF